MEEELSEDPSLNAKTLVTVCTKSIWNRLLRCLPSTESNIFWKISNLYQRTTRATSMRRSNALPLPLPFNSPDTYMDVPEACKVLEVLEDILEHVFKNLHEIQKNLQFWQQRAEGTSARKVYFMVFERGPWAFIDGSIQFVRDCMNEGSGMHHLCISASTHITERINILTKLRFALATFLAQVYMEVEKFGEELVKDPEKSLPVLLINIDDFFAKLEASIGHIHATRRSDSSVDGNYSFPLMFEKLPEVNQEGSQWTYCEITDSINLVYKNLQTLDSYLSNLVAEHRKPKKATLNWMCYTCGVVGLSVCSIWLLKHSRLTGSPDIDNWIREAKDSTISFWNGHVEQPLLAIRDELFETFRTRHRSEMDLEEVKLTSTSLHRMLLAFSEQTKGQKFHENASDQEMLEIVMARYEQELMRPISSLFNGELARALLIQVQKLKLDIETAMLELNQILRANEINFAILAALPAFFLSIGILMFVRAWLKKDTRAEGRGRIARLQRRLLIVEIEKRIMQFQHYTDKGLEKDAQCMFGLVLYSMDRLYRAVEWHAKATGEWQCLKQDIIDLGKAGHKTSDKLIVTLRLTNVYDCLLPSPKRQ